MPYYFISKSKKAVSLWSGCGVRRFLGAVLQWRTIIVLYLHNAELILVCRRNCGFHFFQTRNTWLMKRLSFQPPPIFVLIRWARCKKKKKLLVILNPKCSVCITCRILRQNKTIICTPPDAVCMHSTSKSSFILAQKRHHFRIENPIYTVHIEQRKRLKEKKTAFVFVHYKWIFTGYVSFIMPEHQL